MKVASASTLKNKYFGEETMSGEFAGYAIDESIDAENDRWLYRQGAMTDFEAFNLGVIDNFGGYKHVPMFPKNSNKTCVHCGESNLKWMNTENGWRLSKNGAIHKCMKFLKK